MNISIVLSLAVCLVGAVVHMVAAGKAGELGRLAFGAGLLAFLLKFAGVLQLTS